MPRLKKKDNPVVLIHEVHDLWPKTLIDIGGMSSSNPFVRLMKLGEKVSYKSADYVASTLEYAEEYMQQQGLQEGKFWYISNGIAEEDWIQADPVPQKSRNILEKIKKDHKFIVGYCGGFAISNALDRLIDAAAMMDNQYVVFVLAGDGTERKRIQKRVKDEQLENVIFLDPVQKKCVPSLLSFFDCVYMGVEKELEIYNYGISFTKMYDAMMAGVPVIMSMSDVQTPVEKYGFGLKCHVNDPEGIKNCINRLCQMSAEERRLMGEKGRLAVKENYRYSDLAEKYEDLFPDNTKTVLLINHYAGSNQMGMDFRPYYLAREWKKKGYDVKIIAADFSHLRRKNPKVTCDFQKEIIDDISYYWVKTIQYRGNGVRRAYTMIQFVSKLFFKAKKIARTFKPDVIITASTYPLDIFAAKRIRKYVNK